MAGRALLSRDLSGLGAGRHELTLGRELPANGVYFLELRQGARSQVKRTVIMD